MDIRYSCNQRDFKRYTTEEVRDEMLITGLYKADEVVAVCVLIYIWYRLDARYEEHQKLAAHGGREKDKKKHNN